ncbi:MAG: hypothetical protein J6C02_00235 [Peptococcaceae bacterium]|nr:hypothetical protein [Peptococcaceae bacterium]
MEAKKVNIIHYIICAAFCLLFRFIPPFGGLTAMGVGIVGTFIGAVYGWIMIDMLWPSVLALVGIGLSIGMNQMMVASFGSLTIVAMIVCMMAIGVAMKNGAFTWLAMKLLTNKAMAGRGWTVLTVILLLAWLVGSFNPIIMMMIFASFMISMFEQVGVKKDDKLVVIMFLAVAYQLMRGQILFPFMGTGLTYLMAYNNMFPNLPIPMAQYLTMMVIMGLVMLVVLLVLLKFVFRVDVSPLSNYKPQGEGVPPATKSQKYALILFVVFMLANVVMIFAPGAIKHFLEQFGIVGIAMLMGAVVPLIKDENGKSLGNLEELLSMANWGQIMMVGYIMVVSTQMMMPTTGISAFMANFIKPFMALPPMVFIVVVMVFCLILTNVANNMLCAILCMPFLVNFGSMMGMNPVGMVCLMFIISEFALATPAASPVTGVAFSYTNWVSSNQMMKYGVLLSVILFVVFLIIGWPIAGFVFN